MAWEADAKPVSMPRVLIGVPQRNHFVYDEFWFRLTQMEKPPETDIVFDSGRPLDITRNIFITRCLAGEYSYLFFLDDDIILERDTLVKLIHARTPMVSGVYYSRAPPHNPVAVIGDQSLAKSELGKDELLEVEEVGMGCCLIHRSLLKLLAEKLEWRCLSNHVRDVGKRVYSTDYVSAAQNGFRCKYCDELMVANFFDHTHGLISTDEAAGEDYYFCDRVREIGQKVLLKADCFVGHAVNAIVTREGYYIKTKEGNTT